MNNFFHVHYLRSVLAGEHNRVVKYTNDATADDRDHVYMSMASGASAHLFDISAPEYDPHLGCYVVRQSAKPIVATILGIVEQGYACTKEGEIDVPATIDLFIRVLTGPGVLDRYMDHFVDVVAPLIEQDGFEPVKPVFDMWMVLRELDDGYWKVPDNVVI